jgi:uncharacterized protein (TIGR02757 family)
MDQQKLRDFLNRKSEEYNKPEFLKDDPVQIPHRFSKKQDIEIAGLFAALFAWGNRKTIINKSAELMKLMDDAPHDFILNHRENDLKRFLHFSHRTFNPTDLLFFIQFLNLHYTAFPSLECAFVTSEREGFSMEKALIHFHHYFFSLPDAPTRTRKHISSPHKNSACKRLNMFMRWMVRKDDRGVDLGLWNRISPADLVCPIDVHVWRVAKNFNLVSRPCVDWQSALELTENLRKLDPMDPVKYDFALFGLGVAERF